MSDEEKELVTNYQTLVDAETTYNNLEAADTSNTFASANTSASADNSDSSVRGKLSGGAIAGIAIGSVAALGVVAFVIYWFAKKKKKLSE